MGGPGGGAAEGVDTLEPGRTDAGTGIDAPGAALPVLVGVAVVPAGLGAVWARAMAAVAGPSRARR
jgi:hypothetical protein